MAKRKRGNGEGSLFRRDPSGPWIASWHAPAPGGNGTIRKERSTRTTSRSDAERIARKWVERAALEREGLVAPEGGTMLDRHGAAAIEAHLGDFIAAKRAEGRTSRHIDETATMIREAAAGCEWTALRNIAPDGLERFMARRLAPVADAEGRTPRAWTPRTAHKYATALRTFTRWAVADGRLPADPLARVKKPAPTRQRERRILLVDEWRWLKDAAENGPERMGMDGRSRALLYTLAIQTGLRSGELRTLTRANLALDGERPYVMLEARQTKNRKAARQYVRPDLAADLTRHVSRAMPGSPLFAMPRREHLAAMLRADLADARRAWIDAAGADAAERVRRESSDYLRAENADGQALDFHSLRHTCGAWAALGGASPKALQTLMRHSSILLTLGTYGHLLPDEASETVHRMAMPSTLPLRLTGTLDASDSPPAVDPATGVRSSAQWCASRHDPKTKNAPGATPRAVFKRGGRDSNPQPPDRQSGTSSQNTLETQGFSSDAEGAPAVGPATVADPGLAAVVAAWPFLAPPLRAAILAAVGPTAPASALADASGGATP